MASAVARANNGVWGRAPSGVQGQSSWSGEAEALLVFGRSMEAAKLAVFLKFGEAKNQKFALSLPKIMGGHKTGGLEQN